MIRPLLGFALLLTTSSAPAALTPGAAAPDFTTQGALAGKPFRFALRDALKKGPVVLYFYPKAFTKGCTIEAHQFAEATPEFAKLGATVIGMSNDDLPTLQRFSTEACRDKFAVAAASPSVIRDYDVALPVGGLSNRTSYVIAPNGKIVFVHSDMKPDAHVTGTLAAVKKWRAAKR